jgi:hypothetical protein
MFTISTSNFFQRQDCQKQKKARTRKAHKTFSLFFVFSILVSLILSCTNSASNLAGGTSEVGNPKIYGSLIDQKTGQAAVGVNVFLYKEDNFVSNDSSLQDSTKTITGGDYEFRDVPKGSYSVLARHIENKDTITTFNRGIKIDSLSVYAGIDTLKYPGAISGQVLLNNTGKEGIFCYIPGTSFIATTDSAGNFKISLLPEGTYSLSVSTRPGTVDTSIPLIKVKSGNNTKLPVVKLTQITYVERTLSGHFQDIANPLPHSISYILKSENDTITISGTLGIDTANRMFSRIIRIPENIQNWNILLTFKDKNNHTTGLLSKVFEITSGNIFLNNVNPSNIVPVVKATNDTIVSVNDSLKLSATIFTPLPGGVLMYEWNIGNNGAFIKTTRIDTIVLAPSKAVDSLKYVIRVTDDNGNIASDTVLIKVVEDKPVFIVFPKDTVLESDRDLRCSLYVKNDFNTLTGAVLINNQLIQNIQFTKNSGIIDLSKNIIKGGKNILIRIRDDDSNYVECQFRVKVIPEQLQIQTITSTDSTFVITITKSDEPDFKQYNLFRSEVNDTTKKLIHSETNILDTVFVINEKPANPVPYHFYITQSDTENLVSSISPPVASKLKNSPPSIVQFLNPSHDNDSIYHPNVICWSKATDANHDSVYYHFKFSDNVTTIDTILKDTLINLGNLQSDIHGTMQLCAFDQDTSGKRWIIRKNIHFIRYSRYLDSLALKAFADSTNLSKTSGWISAIPIDLYPLKIKLENNRVVSVNMSGQNIIGTIPDLFYNLSEVRDLYIGNNTLSGKIGSSIKHMKKLQKLDLSYNKFSSNLPPEIAQLDSLEYINLTSNSLSGPFPKELKNFKNLKVLLLDNNPLNIRFPEEICAITSLETLYMPNCNLSGSIPESIKNMVNLKSLMAINNQISGSLPNGIGELKNIENLQLGFNSIQSPLPTSLLNCQNLSSLMLNFNKLNGTVPGWITSIPKIGGINLDYNYFDQIDSSIVNTKKDIAIYLTHNKLCDITEPVLTWLTSDYIDWADQVCK